MDFSMNAFAIRIPVPIQSFIDVVTMAQKASMNRLSTIIPLN